MIGLFWKRRKSRFFSGQYKTSSGEKIKRGKKKYPHGWRRNGILFDSLFCSLCKPLARQLISSISIVKEILGRAA